MTKKTYIIKMNSGDIIEGTSTSLIFLNNAICDSIEIMEEGVTPIFVNPRFISSYEIIKEEELEFLDK